MPSSRSDLVPLAALAGGALAEASGAIVRDGEAGPVLCRTCGAVVETVQAGRWQLASSVCPRCVQAQLDEERRRAARIQGAEGLARARIPERYRSWTWERVAKQQSGEPWAAFQRRVQELTPPHIGITRYSAEAGRLLRDWRPEHGSVYVSGHVGGGKSTMAAATIRGLCERGVLCRYLVEGVLREFTSEQLAQVAAVPVLLWDDWSSTETPPEWMRDRVESLIMRRYDACRPVVFTSNAPLGDATKKWGARVGSRLHEMVGSRRAEIVDHDWRTGEAYGASAGHA